MKRPLRCPSGPPGFWLVFDWGDTSVGGKEGVETSLETARMGACATQPAFVFIAILAGSPGPQHPYILCRLKRVAPFVTAEIIPGAGHDLTVVQPAMVNERILQFLKAQPLDGHSAKPTVAPAGSAPRWQLARG